MAEERFYEVVLTQTISGIVRITDDMLPADRDWEEAAEELAGMDEWEKGSRDENMENVEVLDITALHKARLAKAVSHE